MGENKKKVLHVGCGSRPVHPNFQSLQWEETRLDINADLMPKPDIIADMKDMSMVGDNEFDAVWSSHNLEHLFAHEVPIALSEFYRVLKPSGMLFITMPDLGRMAEHICNGKLEEPVYDSPSGPICAIDVIYGHRNAIKQGNHFMAHKTGFTALTLGQKLQKTGFKNIEIQRTEFDLWAAGYKMANEGINEVQLVEMQPNGQIRKSTLVA